jgi:hypothetical protein
VDAELVDPSVVEAGDPVAALESVLGAGKDREALVDVASMWLNFAAELP